MEGQLQTVLWTFEDISCGRVVLFVPIFSWGWGWGVGGLGLIGVSLREITCLS